MELNPADVHEFKGSLDIQRLQKALARRSSDRKGTTDDQQTAAGTSKRGAQVPSGDFQLAAATMNLTVKRPRSQQAAVCKEGPLLCKEVKASSAIPQDMRSLECLIMSPTRKYTGKLNPCFFSATGTEEPGNLSLSPAAEIDNDDQTSLPKAGNLEDGTKGCVQGSGNAGAGGSGKDTSENPAELPCSA